MLQKKVFVRRFQLKNKKNKKKSWKGVIFQKRGLKRKVFFNETNEDLHSEDCECELQQQEKIKRKIFAKNKKSEEIIMISNQENSSSVSDVNRKFGNLVSENELNKRKSSIIIKKIVSKLTPSNQQKSFAQVLWL